MAGGSVLGADPLADALQFIAGPRPPPDMAAIICAGTSPGRVPPLSDGRDSVLDTRLPGIAAAVVPVAAPLPADHSPLAAGVTALFRGLA